MFKYLYTIRFMKKGTKATPKYLIALYYKSKFVSILGFFDKIKQKALIYFDRLVFYYVKGFRFRKHHRYLDILNIVFVGLSFFGHNYFLNFSWIPLSFRGKMRHLYVKRHLNIHSNFKNLSRPV